MPETHFDEWIAEHYDNLWPELFEPAFVEPSLDVLADLAGGGPALESASARYASLCHSANGE